MRNQKERDPRVYVPNKSYHDFESAEEFGDLVFITEGRIPNRYQLNELAMVCGDALEDAHRDDYLLVAGPTTLNCIVSAILAHKFGRVNFLIYDQRADKYTERTIVLEHGKKGK
jgi:hypothetical protein